MSKRIGEALIDRGLLNPSQLEESLNHQLILGGHLGTTLIELGHTDEDTLARVLSEVHGIPVAPAEMFADIPETILATLPFETVSRRRVVPIGLEDKLLHVAVIDPRQVATLSTSTGYRVAPYIAPEVRVVEALERYYGIERRPRFVRLSAMPGRRRERSKTRQAKPAVSATLLSLSEAMGRVASHGELGEVILDFIGQRAQRSVLFGVTGRRARVANWRGMPLDPESACSIELVVQPRSVFGLALDDRYYRGPVPVDDGRQLFEALGVDGAVECLVVPVYGDERLEAVVYADGGADGGVAGDDDDFLVLADRVALATQMLNCRVRLTAI